jgi:DNA-binding beta-propeller fold protein YncE
MLYGLADSYHCGDGGTCGGRCSLVGIDVATGAALRPVPLDPECSQLEVAPGGRRLFVLNADNTLTVVNSMTDQLDGSIRTSGIIASEGDADFLVTPDGRTIYVADQFRGVIVIPVTHY